MRAHTIQKLILVPTLALGITGIFSSTSLAAPTCSVPAITIGLGETCTNTQILNLTTISNSGTMNGLNNNSAILNRSVINNLTNFSVITNLFNSGALQNGTGTTSGTINLLNNFGSMTATSKAIYNVNGSIGTLNNYNSMISTGGNAIENDASIGLLNNTLGSFITGASFDSGIYNGSGANISHITNAGTISGGYAIANRGTIANLENNGNFNGNDAIYNLGSITNLVNSGTISNTNRVGIYNLGTITTLTNSIGGVISDGGLGAIFNDAAASIVTFNNAQGGDSSSDSKTALVYNGKLPTDYNIIISSPTNYGQLAWTNKNSFTSAGSTNFGIYEGSLITSRLYTGVLQGLATGNVGGTRTGTYDNMNWTLSLQSGSSDNWDLTFSGASLTQTQSSLASHARKLSGTLNIASLISHYPNSSTYDCNLFDVKGMCISAGGRYSTVDNPSSNSSAAVVTLGYKVNSNIRIGGFLDQSVTNNNPTGIDISNKHPMMGAFAYWNQNADGLGYQVKIANAYQDKDLTTTRDVIGTSEAGRGTTSLNSRSYVGELSYAFMFKENTLVRPYFALRHTTIEQDAYTERGVTTPLTYSAINNRTTSALMGVKFKHALTPKANLIGSLGVEQDLHHKTDRLTATGIAGLTSENLSSDLHRTRPVASIGATYDIAKTQRLSGEVLVQQLPFQSTAGATAYFNYMIGF
jgi:hypothetical protein